MSMIVNGIARTYKYINYDIADSRSANFFLVSSPWPVLAILFAYYQFVYNVGPRLMKDRKPLDLGRIMIWYNVLQIALSLYIFIEAVGLMVKADYSLICQPINYEDTPLERSIVSLVWVFYMVKVVDLLDTVFFVLRKKGNQVSTLHVYHHISMVVLGFVGSKYIPAGHGGMLGTINSLVHAVMYTYYLLTSINSEYSKSLWWKKHLTQMQIVQFLLLDLHFLHVLFRPSCTYPKYLSFVAAFQNNAILYMFAKFYYKTYIKKKSA